MNEKAPSQQTQSAMTDSRAMVGKVNMALTRGFKEAVAARVQNDPAPAQALLGEAITLFDNGEPESAKPNQRDLVNAAVGLAFAGGGGRRGRLSRRCPHPDIKTVFDIANPQ